MDFKYVRIQGREVSETTGYAAGIFSICWKLIQQDVMEDEDVELFKEIDSWFAEELPFPEPCMNHERVVCFFKTENTELMMRMITPAMWLLDDYQIAVKIPDIPVVKFNHQWTEPGSGLFQE